MFPVISLPIMTTAPNTYVSISNTPKPILTRNGKIKKAPAQIKVEVNQWTPQFPEVQLYNNKAPTRYLIHHNSENVV
jgi:hypothetical protein